MTWLPSIRLGSQIVTRLCRWMNRVFVTPKHLGLTAILPVLLALAGGAALFLSGSAARVTLLGGRPWQETRVEGRAFPKHLIDPAGMVQILPAPPRRIASAILSGDHILTALVAPDRLAAVTYLVDNPSLSNIAGVVPASVPRIHAEIETILALQPDLVLVAGYTRATTVRLLVAARIPVVRLHGYGSFQGVMRNIRTIGAAVGAETRAERITGAMQRRITAVEQRVRGLPRPRVLQYAAGGYTAGAGTLIDEMIERAGGANVAREAQLMGPARLPLEMAISLQPEVIVVADWSATSSTEAVQALLRDPRWQQVPAITSGRVYAVRGAWLEAVSQYAVRGLEAIARLLHPGVFKS